LWTGRRREPGHKQSGGLFVPGERPGLCPGHGRMRLPIVLGLHGPWGKSGSWKDSFAPQTAHETYRDERKRVGVAARSGMLRSDGQCGPSNRHLGVGAASLADTLLRCPMGGATGFLFPSSKVPHATHNQPTSGTSEEPGPAERRLHWRRRTATGPGGWAGLAQGGQAGTAPGCVAHSRPHTRCAPPRAHRPQALTTTPQAAGS